MLSRVAERIYWLGRYLVRVESTARLINVYSNILLDLPRPAKLIWESLLAINGDTEMFLERYARADERSVVRFYLTDRNNPSSLRCSLNSARENARTVREIVPSNGWEGINDLSMYLNENVDGALTRRGRDEFLNEIIQACQFIEGTIDGTMSRDAAYAFLSLGRHLERADMTSRIVDVGIANVFPWLTWMTGDTDLPEASDETSPYESILWMSVLRSLSGLQMYRRLVPERVVSSEVIEFLISDRAFPKAMGHCLAEVVEALEKLPDNEVTTALARSVLRRVDQVDAEAVIDKQSGADVIDAIQIEISELDQAIQNTWFVPVEAATA